MIAQEESVGLASLHMTSGGLSAGSLFLTGLVNALNLPLYVLGGGVAGAWPLFSQWMVEELACSSSLYRLTDPLRPPANIATKAKTHVLTAKLSASSGLLGACLLPFAASQGQSSGTKNDTMTSTHSRVMADA